MLSWLMIRRGRSALIASEADMLIRDLGVEAYAEARRRERDANDFATARFWSRTASAIAGKIGEQIGLDAAHACGREPDFRALIETFKAQAPRSEPAPPAEIAARLAPAEEHAQSAVGGARSLQDRLKQAFRPNAGGGQP